jgi:hypothetical protein
MTTDNDQAPIVLPNDPVALSGYILGMLAWQWRKGTSEQVMQAYFMAGTIAVMMISFRERMEEEGFPKLPLPEPASRETQDRVFNDPVLRKVN